MNSHLISLDYKKIKVGFAGQEMVTLPPSVRKTVSSNELIKRLYVTAIGFHPHARCHERLDKPGSNQYVLIYCVEGQGTILLKNEEISVLTNNWFIIPKQVAYQYKSSPENPWSIYRVHFMGDHADLLYQQYHGYEDSKESILSCKVRQNQLFKEILSILKRGFERREMEIANIKFFELISSLIYYKEIYPQSDELDPVSSSILFMKENLNSIYSVQELATIHHSSVSHYSRLFHKKIGSSPIYYFNQLKIQRSCGILTLTNKTIKEICKELGFNDPYYFSRLFKKVMGVSPAKYKMKIKQ